MRSIQFYFRLTLFYVCQALLGLTFFYLTYLLTYTLDFFEWGSSQADRFFLIVLPMGLIPIIVVVSTTKFFATMVLQKRLQLNTRYKWSSVVPIVAAFICHFVIGLKTTWWVFAISGTSTLVVAIESLIISRRLWNNNLSSHSGTHARYKNSTSVLHQNERS